MLQMHVAIKVFSPRDDNNLPGFSGQSAGSQSTSKLRERFVQEVRMLAKLTSNPHIVNIIELAELPDSTLYYVMPSLPRSMVDLIGKDALTLDAQRDLPQALQPQRLPVVQALDLLLQVLDALSFVHQAGLVLACSRLV